MPIKALIIGIDEYLGVPDLSICVNDALDWENLLKQTYQVEESNIVCLHSPFNTRKSFVINKLKAFINDIGKNDIGIFIFSGHGTYELVEDSEGLWVEHQLRTRNDTISEVEISEIVKLTPIEARLICILDSCYSGGIELYKMSLQKENNNKDDKQKGSHFQVKTFKKPDSTPIPDHAKFRKTLEENIKSPNVYTLTACTYLEKAYGDVIDNRLNSAFSRFLINCIKKNPNSTYKAIFNNLLKTLPNDTLGFNQTPQIFANKSNTEKIIFTN